MTPIACVREYYCRIDEGDIDWAMNLFADQAVYVRAEQHYQGKQRIDRFFRVERKIRGRHSIRDSHAIDNLVVARGEFSGAGVAGDTRRVAFVDIWTFGDDGLVQLRETYLALGHEYVKE